jgi:N-acetyl-anhydromuramyl-L-alanine amidase AmpD
MAALGPIRFLTIHTTATPEGMDCTAQQIADMDIRRFGIESYHHIVTLDGMDHVRLPDTVKGAHVGGHNTGNVGVSYVGGIDRVTKKPKDTRTAAQRATLRKIVLAYQARYPGIKVVGHRDWSPDLNRNGKIEPNEWVKACPCFDVAAWIAGGMA